MTGAHTRLTQLQQFRCRWQPKSTAAQAWPLLLLPRSQSLICIAYNSAINRLHLYRHTPVEVLMTSMYIATRIIQAHTILNITINSLIRSTRWRLNIRNMHIQ